MILDTNALSAFADEDPAILAILAKVEQLAIPVIVLGEYRYGIGQSRNRAGYATWLNNLLPDCMVLDVNEQTALYYSDIHLELRQAGRPIPTNDIWIAALCRQYRLPLLSRDRHFDFVSANRRLEW